MARVRLEVNGRGYEIVAEDGQEGHVSKLGDMIASRVKGIVRQVGQVGEGRLILMAALQIADEAQAFSERITYLETQELETNANQGALEKSLSEIEKVYEDLADRLEKLVTSLD